MSGAPKLALVVAPEQPIDITAKLRADINDRDWSAAHIWADRQKPISLPEGRKWGWR